ncbi:helix-turn-helix domain-containing protein [Acetobacterium wieringae]
MSQVILAKELGISPSAVTMYEQGKRDPRAQEEVICFNRVLSDTGAD